jgi:hypothetical protein
MLGVALEALGHIHEVTHNLHSIIDWEPLPVMEAYPARVFDAIEAISTNGKQIICLEVDEAYDKWSNLCLTQVEDVGIFRVKRGTPRLWQRTIHATQLGHALLYTGFPDDRWRLPPKFRATEDPRLVLWRSTLFGMSFLSPRTMGVPRSWVEEVQAGTPRGQEILCHGAGNLDIPPRWAAETASVHLIAP